jgi:hypothetical protein
MPVINLTTLIIGVLEGRCTTIFRSFSSNRYLRQKHIEYRFRNWNLGVEISSLQKPLLLTRQGILRRVMTRVQSATRVLCLPACMRG